MIGNEKSPLLAGEMGSEIPRMHYSNGFTTRQHQSLRKRIPPYSKTILTLFEAQRRPKNDIWLFLGKDAWRRAKGFSTHQCVLTLPEEAEPGDFYWPVQHCTVLCVETSQQPVKLLADLRDCLLAYGARGVCFMRHNYKLHYFGEFYEK